MHRIANLFVSVLAMGVAACAAPAAVQNGSPKANSLVNAPSCSEQRMADLITNAILAGQKVNQDGCDWSQIGDLVEGYAIQEKVIAQLDQKLTRVGYKVTGTGEDARAAMGIYYPIVGVIFSGAMQPSGTPITIGDRQSMVLEADLIVRVKDEGINDAQYLADVARHIDQIIPFAEVPMPATPGGARSGPMWAAVNGAAGLGFVGKPIAVNDSEEFIKSLATMKVRLTDSAGQRVSGGIGSDILGNPLYSIIELNNEMLNRGERLKKGDYISLGNFGRPIKPKSGESYTLTYEGLAGQTVSVVAKFD